MALTSKEKRRIYEEEKERIRAREKIAAEKTRAKPSAVVNWTIIIGFVIMLYIIVGSS